MTVSHAHRARKRLAAPPRAACARSALTVEVAPSGYDEPTTARRLARAELATYPRARETALGRSAPAAARDRASGRGGRYRRRPRRGGARQAARRRPRPPGCCDCSRGASIASTRRLRCRFRAPPRRSRSSRRRACASTRSTTARSPRTSRPASRSTKPAATASKGRAAALVEAIDGDFYTVMGFPLGSLRSSAAPVGICAAGRESRGSLRAASAAAPVGRHLHVPGRTQTLRADQHHHRGGAGGARANRRAALRDGEPDRGGRDVALRALRERGRRRSSAACAAPAAMRARLPQLERDNARTARRKHRAVDKRTRGCTNSPPRMRRKPACASVVDLYHGIEARVIGFPPENESRAVTIDKGANAGRASRRRRARRRRRGRARSHRSDRSRAPSC